MRAQQEAEIVACIPSLRRYARGLTPDRERADDLVQDTLERASGKLLDVAEARRSCAPGCSESCTTCSSIG